MVRRMTLDPDAFERLRRKLHELWLSSAPLQLDLVTALDELRDWLDDEHWWEEGSHAGWLALVDDVLHAVDSVSSPLRSVISSASAPLTIELNTFRAALKRDRKDGQHARAARSTATRTDLLGCDAVLRQAIATPACVHAAWLALLEAYSNRADERALDQRHAELWRFAESLGHPSDRLVRLLRGVLDDSERFVTEARRAVSEGTVQLGPRDPERGAAGLPIVDRFDLIEQYLLLPVAEAQSEVWVGVEDAFFDGRVEVGPVTFWQGSALREAIQGGTEVHLPDVVTRHGELFSWLWKRREEGASFALARVLVASGTPSAARADAKDTVRALLALAEFDEGYTAWRVAERGLLHFVDDQWVFREQLGPGRQPKGLDRAQIARDNTPAALRARAPSVGPKLPLRATTVDVRHAFELLHWLAQGRATPGPARIVLTKRVIERAAGWARVKEDTFTDQQLAIPWARRQTLSRISDATSAALAVLKDAADDKHRIWLEAHNEPRRIIVGYPGSRTAIDTSKALEHLEWFAKDLEAGSEAGDELDGLRPLVATGAAYADWIDRLLEEFGHLRRRYSRHRNAVVHGGPINDQSIETILLFADALAVDTLAAAIEAVLSARPLHEYFARRKQGHNDWLAGMRTSNQPLHELIGVPL